MKSKSSRGKEIIKIQVEIIKIENLKAIEKIKETKLALCRDKQNQQTFSQTHHEKKNSKSIWKRCYKRYHKRIIRNYYEWSSEKAMAPHSSTLAYKIPWMEEPGGLQSMGPLGVRHDWASTLSLFTFMLWRRKWQPTPVLLPGKSHGRRSLVGCSPWGR